MTGAVEARLVGDDTVTFAVVLEHVVTSCNEATRKKTNIVSYFFIYFFWGAFKNGGERAIFEQEMNHHLADGRVGLLLSMIYT